MASKPIDIAAALRILAEEVQSPDNVPQIILNEAADLIESGCESFEKWWGSEGASEITFTPHTYHMLQVAWQNGFYKGSTSK